MAMKSEENILDEQNELSPERACEILKNVFRACKMEPPSDCEKYFYKKDLILSILSPKNSILTGISLSTAKTSIIPPRTENCPFPSTVSDFS